MNSLKLPTTWMNCVRYRPLQTNTFEWHEENQHFRSIGHVFPSFERLGRISSAEAYANYNSNCNFWPDKLSGRISSLGSRIGSLWSRISSQFGRISSGHGRISSGVWPDKLTIGRISSSVSSIGGGRISSLYKVFLFCIPLSDGMAT